MIAPADPQRPGPLGHVWNTAYEFGYGALRAVALMIARPLFRVRRVGPVPPLPRGAAIYCANHASYLDPAFVQLVVRRRIVFVMTNDFYRLPAGRWFFRLVGAIPVGSGRLAREGMEKAIALLRDGVPIGIFPEGRLSRTGEVGEGQRGVAILSRMGQAPVIPMGIGGNFRAWPHGRRWLRRSDVRVAFGHPIPPPPPQPGQGRREQVAFTESVMTAIRTAREWARSAPHRPLD